MRTDKQIHEILHACPQWVFMLAGLDDPGACRMRSPAVKESERRIDALVVPASRRQPLIVAEIEFRRDRMVLVRTGQEMAMIQFEYPQREVRGLVIFATRRMDVAPAGWNWRRLVQVVYLDEALEALRQSQPHHPMLSVFAPVVIKSDAELESQAAACYQNIRRSRLPLSTRQILEKVLLVWLNERFKNKSSAEIAMILNLPDIETTRSGRELIAKGMERGEKRGYTIGEKRGMERGMECGMERGRAVTLARMAVRCFGRNAAALASAIAALPAERLTDLENRLLDFPDAAALRDWLKPKKAAARK